jgi:hypothetical protein
MVPDRTEAMPPAAELAPLVELAIGAIQREYPYHLTLLLAHDQDLALPRALTPAFRGAFDWHSSVHAHWTLVRALRVRPGAPWSARARAVLAMSFTGPRLEAEEAFLRAPGREGWERPYGLAWLLQLVAELRGWDDEAARAWTAAFKPLELLASARMLGWLERLPWPVRSGEHAQSAFAMGLFHDWARDSGRADLAARIAERGVRLYGADREAPVRYEPSGQDFLSPILGEADLMRRCVPADAYTPWLVRLLPAPDAHDLARWLAPVTSPDPADGKFAHLDGLNLSRAWMLEGVVSALPPGHPIVPLLTAAAAAHRDAGLAATRGGHYAGTHWLGSFATYLLTRRGLS